MNIRYTSSLDGVDPSMLQGFFVGWASPPTPPRHMEMLRGSDRVVLAIDDDRRRVVGFVNALCDGVQAAFIPCIEVLPDHQRAGVGSELMRRMLDQRGDIRCVDLTCDAAVQPFYERFAMQRSTGMVIRRYARQDSD